MFKQINPDCNKLRNYIEYQFLSEKEDCHDDSDDKENDNNNDNDRLWLVGLCEKKLRNYVDLKI